MANYKGTNKQHANLNIMLDNPRTLSFPVVTAANLSPLFRKF